jgi:hypothetical protein
MRRSPIVRRLLVLLATSAMLGSVFLASTPAVTAFVANPPCTSANLSPSSAAANPGTTITLTASSTGCNMPAEFQFYLQPPGGAWGAKGAFSTTTTFSWNTTGLATGIWGIGVRARASGTAVAYQAYYTGTLNLYLDYCTGVAVSPDLASPSNPGTSIVFTASTTGCSAEFRFLALPPGGTWRTLRGYSSSNTFTWDTTGLARGTWQIGAWARAVGSRHSYDLYILITYVLSPSPHCAYGLLGSNVPSPQAAGATVSFYATANLCYGSLSSLFEYWRQAPGGAWTMVQGYANQSFNWDTTGFANGRYQIGMRTKAVGSTKSYDTYQIITFYIGT